MIVDRRSAFSQKSAIKNLQSQDTDSSRYTARRIHSPGERQGVSPPCKSEQFFLVLQSQHRISAQNLSTESQDTDSSRYTARRIHSLRRAAGREPSV